MVVDFERVILFEELFLGFDHIAREEDVMGVGFCEYGAMVFCMAGCRDDGQVGEVRFADGSVWKMAEAAGVVEVVVGEDDGFDPAGFYV